jgi:5-methylcytosine-specific restriction endonuclease McrA
MTEKQKVRENFRASVLKRSGCRCEGPDCKGKGRLDAADLDAHHITDRNLMPKGGYVKENGIALCSSCHLKAEQYHVTGIAHEGYEPETLYTIIGSSYELALKASDRL